MIGVVFEPVDTLFFRDGTPFSSGTASQASAGGLFPPPPPSIAGVVRAALARCNGWDGRGRWNDLVAEVLGDGPLEMGCITLVGPIIVKDSEPLMSDLGAVRLPYIPNGTHEDPLKPLSGLWITRKGFEKIAGGEVPSSNEIVALNELWDSEHRVGIARNRETRTAENGMLYSATHVRCKPGVGLGVLIDGIPESWNIPEGSMVPIGGEGRLATWSPWPGKEGLTVSFDHVERSRVAFVALTPIDPGHRVTSGGTLPGLEGLSLVSVCCDRAERIGGWDSGTREPVPLHGVLPAGSVLFFECSDGDIPGVTEGTTSIVRAGLRTAQGFGALAPMSWPKKAEVR